LITTYLRRSSTFQRLATLGFASASRFRGILTHPPAALRRSNKTRIRRFAHQYSIVKDLKIHS
jgi:hypothetical protein